MLYLTIQDLKFSHNENSTIQESQKIHVYRLIWTINLKQKALGVENTRLSVVLSANPRIRIYCLRKAQKFNCMNR